MAVIMPRLSLTDQTREDRKDVAAKVRAAGSSFYWAMRLQPPDKRAGLFAIYAFCREVDDIADGDANVANPRRALENWILRLEQIYGGRTTDALDRCLSEAIATFALRQGDFLRIIEGMMMDAQGPVVRPAWEKLQDYCDCVASAVGRLCIRVFGDPSPDARTLANAQGMALQLTNIIRDVEEDAAMGRLYLPEDILISEGLADATPQTISDHPNLPDARAALGQKAEAYFAEAHAAASQCDAVAIRPAMMMMQAYEQTFCEWKAHGWVPPKGRMTQKLRKRFVLMGQALALWARHGA